jgi:hypothetical protein
MSVDEDEITTTVYFNGGLTTAYAYDSVTGLLAKGHALHNLDDEYNWQTGFDLAVVRAKSRLYRKIEKEIVRSTK